MSLLKKKINKWLDNSAEKLQSTYAQTYQQLNQEQGQAQSANGTAYYGYGTTGTQGNNEVQQLEYQIAQLNNELVQMTAQLNAEGVYSQNAQYYAQRRAELTQQIAQLQAEANQYRQLGGQMPISNASSAQNYYGQTGVSGYEGQRENPVTEKPHPIRVMKKGGAEIDEHTFKHNVRSDAVKNVATVLAVTFGKTNFASKNKDKLTKFCDFLEGVGAFKLDKGIYKSDKVINHSFVVPSDVERPIQGVKYKR
jgi:hypothetical protein